MKEILKDFSTLFANGILVICLMVASFLVLINLYHSKEVSYEYYAELSEDDRYTSIKDSIEVMKTNVEAVPSSNNPAASGVKQVIDRCITALESSSFYKLAEKDYIHFKDIYNANSELASELNNTCLFALSYTTSNDVLGNTEYASSYEPVNTLVEEERNIVITQTDYLKNRLLANSTYSYMTDTTRNSIFNETEANLFLLVSSYDRVTSSLERVTNWYADTFGGNNV